MEVFLVIATVVGVICLFIWGLEILMGIFEFIMFIFGKLIMRGWRALWKRVKHK